ncbi:MAG: hypothetical protein AB7N91_07205 [Candidatus Tectimicrobiota bacterium]
MATVYTLRCKQIALTLAVGLSVALLVNWAVLQLLGQKSLYRAEHSLVGILLLMLYIARGTDAQVPPLRAVGFFVLALGPCYFGTVFPDLDITFLGIGRHRNPFFHSSLSFFLLWLCVRRSHPVARTLVAGYGIGLASHLWWDMLFYGDVRWLPGRFLDRLWLGVHGLLCLLASGSGILRGRMTGQQQAR